MKKYLSKFSFSSSGGFTVLETIVAILILSLSISGVFAAVQQGLSQGTIAKEEVVAFYLAQEAIEIIKNKRDTNQLEILNSSATVNSWLEDIAEDSVNDPCYEGKTCRADAYQFDPAHNYSLINCSSDLNFNSCPLLQQDTVTYLWSYVGWPETRFKRSIQIDSINSNEISVTVRISWSKGTLSREFKVKTLLFNRM